jgi:hypothetical protein
MGWYPLSICGLAHAQEIPIHYLSHNNYYCNLVPPNAECACPGEVLSYTCTAVGPGSTVYTGSVFNCPSSQDRIVFRHSEFQPGSVKRCTDGHIAGQPLVASNDTFTSQLNVSVDAELNNGVVECGTLLTNIGTSAINVVSGKNVY